jgi:hypothetical protein
VVPDALGVAACDFALPVGEHTLSFSVEDLDGNITLRERDFIVRAPDEVDDDGDASDAEGDALTAMGDVGGAAAAV